MSIDIDLADTVVPKSDQLNAEDLLTGPVTITVTRVRKVREDQPIVISFEGDNGKPYKPCKSMRRVLLQLWGRDAAGYAGKRMTLFCDPNVMFGGAKVGGIRISHMSDIDGEKKLSLIATKGTRKPYTVKPLQASQAAGKSAGADERTADGAQGGLQSPPADDGFPGDLPPPGEHVFKIASRDETRETRDAEQWAGALETMFASSKNPAALWEQNKNHVADAEIAGFTNQATRVWAAAGKRGVEVQ